MLGCTGGAPAEFSSGGELAQVVPGGEPFDEVVVVRVRELGQDPVQRGFEVQQVPVARLQQSVLAHAAAHEDWRVLFAFAGLPSLLRVLA